VEEQVASLEKVTSMEGVLATTMAELQDYHQQLKQKVRETGSYGCVDDGCACLWVAVVVMGDAAGGRV